MDTNSADETHSDDSINLKGLNVLKIFIFLFISRLFFIRPISIHFMIMIYVYSIS